MKGSPVVNTVAKPNEYVNENENFFLLYIFFFTNIKQQTLDRPSRTQPDSDLQITKKSQPNKQNLIIKFLKKRNKKGTRSFQITGVCFSITGISKYVNNFFPLMHMVDV